MTRSILLPLATLLAIALSACTGQIQESPSRPGSGGSDGSGPEEVPLPQACEPEEMPVGVSRIQRLTRKEYENTVRDLLGDWATPEKSLPRDEIAAGFRSNVSEPLQRLEVEQYAAVAASIAERSVEHVSDILPCSPSTDGREACKRELIESFGRRAFRRPLTEEERGALLALFDAGAELEDGVRLVIEGVLQAPTFLHRLEGDGDERPERPLSPYELASRLSYLLWNTMPDDELFAAAESGALNEPEELEAQARRLLDDPRASEVIADFHVQWLWLDAAEAPRKDDTIHPDYSPELFASMVQETRAFATFVLQQGDASLSTLLTADFTFVDPALAELYGTSPTTPPDEATRAFVDTLPPDWSYAKLPAAERSGLLTHGSVLANLAKPAQTDPVMRGIFVLEQLLCEEMPDPPPGVDATAPEPDPDVSARELYRLHSEDPACASCHRLIDPVGFGFEHYDAVGRFRATDRTGEPIDASGALVEDAGETTFDGVVELGRIVDEDPRARRCAVRQWYRYAHGRHEQEVESCALEALENDVAEGRLDLRELIVRIVLSPAFRYVRTE